MKVIREPLLHFLLFGVNIFVIHGVVSRHRTDKPGEIVVTEGTIENLTTGFVRTWQRPPSEDELKGLLRDYIREEAAYREALALGLDRDDMIVRRRLRQKLEFLSDEFSTQTEPSENDLQRYLQSHPDRFKREPVLSFRQIYFNPQLHRDVKLDAAQAAQRVAQRVSGEDVSNVGDPSLLAPEFQSLSLADLKKTFGDEFATVMLHAPIGAWYGPVESGYGVHLVYTTQRIDACMPSLADVRGEVRREWMEEERRQATDRLYESILKRYKVRFEASGSRIAARVR